jgi:hypothetical protein
MWQATTFDPDTIDEELGWAEQAGYNSVRVPLQYLVWETDPAGQKQRIGKFLSIAARHGMTTVPCFFDDVWFGDPPLVEPYLGKQREPKPGEFAPGWTPSPGPHRVTDRLAWPMLRRYVQDIVVQFGNDGRILMWDIYNEPGNRDMGRSSLSLTETALGWAADLDPMQPITTGAWTNFDGAMTARMMDLCDVLTFHCYDRPDEVESAIAALKRWERPILCTEFMHRPQGNTFGSILPMFAHHGIGWFNRGLVAGRTHTYMHSFDKAGTPEHDVWQHDVFHNDGTAYDPTEIELISSFQFETAGSMLQPH